MKLLKETLYNIRGKNRNTHAHTHTRTNTNTHTRMHARQNKSEIYLNITKMTPERHHWLRSRLFIVNFEHISYIVLVFTLLTSEENRDWVEIKINTCLREDF